MQAGDNYNYISHLPAEIFEQILSQIDALALGRLKECSKKFKKSLENPTAWKKMFDDRFRSTMSGSNYFDSENINWSKEMNLLAKIRRNTKVPGPGSRFSINNPAEPGTKINVFNNHILIEKYASMDIKKCAWVSKWEGYLIIGGYAGLAKPDPQGGHQFHDLFTEKTPFVYKRLYECTKSTLVSFNKTLAVLLDFQRDKYAIWNLSTICKHTDEVLWKKSTKKNEFCKQCAFVCDATYDTLNYEDSQIHCSQINQKIVLVMTRGSYPGLRVIRPLKGTSFDIPLDDMSKLDLYERAHVCHVAAEQFISIDGSPHHIVHCVIGNQNHFYDLTAKRLMATFNRGTAEKWIPNTCYFAIAQDGQVTVHDLVRKKMVSNFVPANDVRSYFHKRPYNNSQIFSIEASRSGTVLFIAKDNSYYGSETICVCSALTGAEIARFNSRSKNAKLVLSDDEKTLLVYDSKSIAILQLRDILCCLQPNFKQKKLLY